eukprot:GFYU01001218.1.p1 GENE.GFYU01001218.1~~GFYU01001218.1.p1  ORF type:complete len:254 (+),score=81.44 GFYU01001218.1:41-802(+)
MNPLHEILFWLRWLLVFVWYLLTFIYGSIFVLFDFGNPNNTKHLGKVLYVCIKLFGMKIHVDDTSMKKLKEREEKGEPCVFVANHQSSLDVPILSYFWPHNTVPIGKRSILYIPFFGVVYAGCAGITIDRKDRTSAVEALNKLVRERVVKKKHSVMLFPEGTRNREPNTMLPFKKGAFHMAVDAGVPIVPIVISDLSRHYSFKQHRAGSGGILEVRVLDEIKPGGTSKKDVEDLLDKTFKAMDKVQKELNKSE